MEIKDFNTINLSLEQKKLLKKKIGQGGGSASDEGIAIFEVEDENTYSITFKLLAGKPKINDSGYLEAIFISKWYDANYICQIENNRMLVDCSYFNPSMGFVAKRLECSEFNINDFVNLNVGESVVITGVPITMVKSINNYKIKLSKTTPTDLSIADVFVNINNIVDCVLCMIIDNLNHIKIGYITEIYVSQAYFIVRFDDELCKFSFDTGIGNPNSRIQTITFVEVVQS